jgi:hypothetical protein
MIKGSPHFQPLVQRSEPEYPEIEVEPVKITFQVRLSQTRYRQQLLTHNQI